MSMDIVLFALRVIAGLFLLSFIGALLVMMWRDYQAVSREVVSRTRKRGRLLVVRAEGTAPGNRHEVVGIDQAVDGRQLAALQGVAQQSFHGGLLSPRIDTDLAQNLLEAWL